ncbi:MAG: tRNA 2-thiouridine(34) synthase MnmA [Pseudomonadota bacterium]
MTTPPATDGPVFVALSGGVDSSVAALLLHEQGYAVEALHMTNWRDDDGYCSAADDLADARAVAELLGLPLHHVDFTDEYRERVFAAFLRDYERGLTPNPDVLCNREIKFGVLLAHARRLGAAALATGHYARVTHIPEPSRLRLAADGDKDQTYFLHAVTQQALGAAMFPLGCLTKREVRAIAGRRGLPTRAKKDSTGICFIGERPFREFLGRYIAALPGPIETADGEVIGRHDGVAYYTVGQRKGLRIGGVAGAAEAPWYVARRDIGRNALIVVQGESHPWLWSGGLSAAGPHWIDGGGPPLGPGVEHRLRARIRHRHRLAPCRLGATADGALAVEFDEAQWAVAAGQYIVFYDDDVCLGGATITGAYSRNARDTRRLAV